MFYLKKILFIFLLLINPLYILNTYAKTVTIGVIVPIKHHALNSIVEGFVEKIQQYDNSIRVIVKNALGDLNLQRSIIEQFKYHKVDIMVPIALGPTQMAASLNSEIPIVSLAANFDNALYKNKNVTGVSDEIDRGYQMDLLKSMYPNLKKFTLIYSGSEKIIPEVNDVIEQANKRNMIVHRMMIKDLSELYGISRMIPNDSETIFLLKDNLVVSGIKTLVKAATRKRIPLITSDEGTIIKGASFALGVEEKQIGIQGAQLAIKVLAGMKVQDLPYESMETLRVFYNSQACRNHKIDIMRLKNIASEMKYSLVDVYKNTKGV